MYGLFTPYRLEEDALYLGVLTAWRIKPLSRLEYPVAAAIMDLLGDWGLFTATVTRIAMNGVRRRHVILSADPKRIEAYCAEFDHAPLRGETPDVVRSEARHFGYPACCAEAFVQTPYAPNSLTPDEQALLFHHACPGCRATPHLLPLYRAALAEARRCHGQVLRNLPGSP